MVPNLFKRFLLECDQRNAKKSLKSFLSAIEKLVGKGIFTHELLAKVCQSYLNYCVQLGDRKSGRVHTGRSPAKIPPNAEDSYSHPVNAIALRRALEAKNKENLVTLSSLLGKPELIDSFKKLITAIQNKKKEEINAQLKAIYEDETAWGGYRYFGQFFRPFLIKISKVKKHSDLERIIQEKIDGIAESPKNKRKRTLSFGASNKPCKRIKDLQIPPMDPQIPPMVPDSTPRNSNSRPDTSDSTGDSSGGEGYYGNGPCGGYSTP